MDAERAARLIAAAFPDVAVKAIRPFGEGWANANFLVNEALLFRFPKTAQEAAAARVEMRLLPILAAEGRLPVPVPDYRFVALHRALDYPWPFGGYRLLPGTPVAGMDRSRLHPSLPGVVGDFLTALHRFPVERALALGVTGGTPQDWRAHYQEWYTATRNCIWPYLNAAEQAGVARFIERFLADGRHFRFQPVLLHHDLSPDHLLADPETGMLRGVIDFGDAIVGDPCFDLIGVVHLGPEVLERYRGPVDAGFSERMRFYTRLWPLHEIRYGVESGRPGHIAAGLARLRSDLDG